MTVDMVKILLYVRKNPNSSKETLMKELKLEATAMELSLASLVKRNLVKLDANKKVYPVGEPVKQFG